MSLSHCHHWIFDMDGTLTQPVHDFDWIRAELGIEMGNPILEAIGRMPAAAAEEAKVKLDELEMELAWKAVAQPGAEAFLQALRDKGLALGILTRNGEHIAQATLEACGLLGFFEQEVVIGRETCAPKPEPDGVEYLVNYWGADRSNTVIVGDYRYDIEAGRACGIQTVHFDTAGQFQWPEFMDYGVMSFSELHEIAFTSGVAA